MLRNILRWGIDSLILCESFFHHKSLPTRIGNIDQKRVLIMRKDGLGDCIIFYPTLRAYRDYYKNAEITLIFPTYFKDLEPLLSKDLVDKVIWFDHKRFGISFSYRRKFLLDLKHGGYDTFIYPVFSRETIGFFMMQMTGAQERIGFDGDISDYGKKSERRGTLNYTQLIKVPDEMKSEIIRDTYFVETITGTPTHITFPTIDIAKLPNTIAQKLINENKLDNGKYAIVFPGAGAQYRIWPADRFAKIVDYINSKGITPVICGSSKEKVLVDEIVKKTTLKESVINLCGKTDLASLAHILAQAQFYFGSDTGILHLAAAVNTPCIAIMGMGGLDRFFPYGNLQQNRIIRDRTKTYITGNWSDAHLLKPGEIHPSIANITVIDAQKEIDFLLQYLA